MPFDAKQIVRCIIDFRISARSLLLNEAWALLVFQILAVIDAAIKHASECNNILCVALGFMAATLREPPTNDEQMPMQN